MIIDNTIKEIESGREYTVDKCANGVTMQVNGAAVSVQGTVDGENWADVAAVNLSDYSASSVTDTGGIYKIMLAGGLCALKFTFSGGTVTACAT